MKKYKLTGVTKQYGSVTLYQIEALKDFGNISKGDKGGYIEKEDNLSQDGDAWVYDNAEVYGDARVYGNAKVYGNAWVCDNAEVYGDAWVYGDAEVYGDARVYGNAEVYGDAKVYGDLRLIGGYFYHLKEKSEEIERVEVSNDYELLACDPKIEEAEEDEPVKGKKVSIRLDDGQIVTGTIID